MKLLYNVLKQDWHPREEAHDGAGAGGADIAVPANSTNRPLGRLPRLCRWSVQSHQTDP